MSGGATRVDRPALASAGLSGKRTEPGLDGVVPRADGYLNPAVDQLEEGMADDRRRGAPGHPGGQARVDDRPAVPGHDRDGRVQPSFTLPIRPDARAEGAALRLAARMGTDPAMVVHDKGLGPAASAADVLPERVVVVRAGGTVVVPDRVKTFSGVSPFDTPLTDSGR